MRFKRIKTALQQGLSLFKDPSDFLTCPLHSLAVAMVLQEEPGPRIFPQFCGVSNATLSQDAIESLGLLELLDGEEEYAEAMETDQATPGQAAPPGAHAYINRL